MIFQMGPRLAKTTLAGGPLIFFQLTDYFSMGHSEINLSPVSGSKHSIVPKLCGDEATSAQEHSIWILSLQPISSRLKELKSLFSAGPPETKFSPLPREVLKLRLIPVGTSPLWLMGVAQQ